MADSRAAVRYAKALLDLSVERGVVEQVHADLQLFVQTGVENRSLVTLLDSPVIPHHKKLAILRGIFEARFHPVTFSIFEIIVRKNRENILFAVARAFHVIYNEYKGIQAAQLVTTFAIQEPLRTQFKDMVRKASGKQVVELTEKVDPKLIGGYVLHIGDRQIDESVKGKLQRLQQQMAKN